jgi:alkaline phosphatase
MKHRILAAFAGATLFAANADALTVSRLTPPSELFATAGASATPIISRFAPGQRFDLQATIQPDAGQTISAAQFLVDGVPIAGAATLIPATVAGLPANTAVATVRAYSNLVAGVHTLSVVATQSDSLTASASGNFEVVRIQSLGRKTKNIIIMLGDGMGSGHRTAARIMLSGVAQGKVRSPLAMDTFPTTASIMTASLNSIVTDSAPGMQNYVTGNKSANNQEGVWPDDTTAAFDNPRVEYLSEYLARTQAKKLGIVTTADVFDATPASNAVHTQARGNGTGIVDQYLDDRAATGLTVLLGGGRKWFLPNPTNCPATGCGTAAGFNGSQRANASDYVLPADLTAGWGVAAGALDPGRDLIADFQAAGFSYAATRTDMAAASSSQPLLGLFALSNMNIALDKIAGRRGSSTLVNDYGFPDQPMLDEMTAKALSVLDAQSPNGFVLMVEGASIDKQAHNMDTERFILDTIEFDRAIGVAKDYATAHPDTLVIVTADHECGGVAVIGASRVTDADLQTRIATGIGTAQVRDPVVGTYDLAGFPRYTIAADGYPTTTDVDYRMLIGYAANADRFEDWRTNPQPLRDSQQPGNGTAPLSLYPSLPVNRDVIGNFRITGQIGDTIAAHTANDIPLSAYGRGTSLIGGTMDNTDVFFALVQAAVGGSK